MRTVSTPIRSFPAVCSCTTGCWPLEHVRSRAAPAVDLALSGHKLILVVDGAAVVRASMPSVEPR